MERVQGALNNHWGLKDRSALLRLVINDYILKGQRPHTTHSYTKHSQFKEKKLVEKERQQKKAKYTSNK